MIIRDRVAQTTNSIGSGNIELNGTLAGFKTFAGALPAIPAASDKLFPVLVKDGDAWEIFESYLISGSPNQLARGALINSSAIDGSRIALSSAENKPVYLLEPAENFGPMAGRSRFAVTAGTAPDYTASFPSPIRDLKNGAYCIVRFHALNPSEATTFTPDGRTTKPMRFGRPLRKIATGRIVQDLLAVLAFSEAADAWIVISPLPQVTKTVTGTSYTVLEEDHETRLIFTNAAAVAVTVPQATGQFAAPFFFDYTVAGAGTVTFTPGTSTISSPTADAAASLASPKGSNARWFADGGNYRSTQPVATQKMPPQRRQTVLSGPLDSSGLPNFGGSTGSATVTASGTLIATASNGFDVNGPVDRIGSIVNPSWTGLSTNGTMYLYLDIAADGTCTTGATTLAPNYQQGGTYSTTNNQLTFNIQEMVGKVGNGSVANQTYRVFVGEVTVASNVVSAIRWYAVLARYRASGLTVTLSTTLTATHNIGVRPREVAIWLNNVSAEGNYSPGDDPILGWWLGSNNASQGINPTAGPRTIELNQAAVLNILDKSTHGFVNVTVAKWNWIVEADRGW